MSKYGSVDSKLRRQSPRHTISSLLRFGVVTFIVSAIVITLSALINESSNTELILTQLTLESSQSPILPGSANQVLVFKIIMSFVQLCIFTFWLISQVSTDQVDLVMAPTNEDADQFKQGATSALAQIAVVDASITDLPDACGVSLYPCAQKIISCANQHLTQTTQGLVTPRTGTCDCFSRGFSEGIDIPGKPDVQFSCSYPCVDSLLKFTSQYVTNINGASGAQITCDISNLAALAFGNTNGYIPTATDSDSLMPIAIDDRAVVNAAEALRLNINAYRVANCPERQSYDDSGKIIYAKKGLAGGGKSQYRLEVVFGTDVVLARLAHLDESSQMINPTLQATLNDTNNLAGTYSLASVTPGPCDDAIGEQLAVTASGVSQINKQKLPWKAMLREEFVGKKIKDFGLGDIPLTPEVRKAFYVELDTTSFTPPPAYDARDIYAVQTPCQAYNVLDQGGCGCCYAFAAATAFAARMCRFNPNSMGNVVVSPQQFLDCANGCNGGNSLTVYQTLINTPAVELWCDPYVGSQQTCNSVCGTGNTLSAQPSSARVVGGAGTYGVLQMQLELIRGGPGVVSFMVMSDFMGYSGGIYTPSATATQVGGHSVTLIGWGVSSGTPYWIVQNSWGPGWGENGFFRIVLGQDVCTIESRGGLTVVKPLSPTACPNSNCANGAITLKNCACQCVGIAKTGPTCSTCALNCKNGGVLDSACTYCTCPLGFFGPMCEGGYTVKPLASCIGDGTSISVSYSFGGATQPPTQTSFIGIYAVGQTGPFQSLTSGSICGSVYKSYSATVNGGLCPSTGSFKFAPPQVAGQYSIVVAPFTPASSGGGSG